MAVMTKNKFRMDILQFLEYLVAAHMVRERVHNNSAADSGKIDDQIINGVAQNKGNCIAWLNSIIIKIPAIIPKPKPTMGPIMTRINE